MDPSKFSHGLDGIRQMAPKTILSSHLPPAQGKTEQILKLLAAVLGTEPYVAPNQAALERMLAQMRGGD